jgi:hypothetical protein
LKHIKKNEDTTLTIFIDKRILKCKITYNLISNGINNMYWQNKNLLGTTQGTVRKKGYAKYVEMGS